MKRRPLVLMALSLSAAPAWAGWNRDGYWDDGLAEVAVYEAERFVDGYLVRYEETIVTRKEELRRDNLARVESAVPGHTMTVLKMNQARTHSAGNVPVSFLTSIYAEDAALERAVKISVGAQDWNGNAYKLFTRGGANRAGRLRLHSYDGEPDRVVDIPLRPGDYFEDQLPLSLRALPFSAAYEAPVRLFSLLTTPRASLPLVQQARLRIAGMDRVRCGAGTISCWKVEVSVRRGGAVAREMFWFDQEYPHVLVRMATSDGRHLLLKSRARWAYWDPGAARPPELN